MLYLTACANAGVAVATLGQALSAISETALLTNGALDAERLPWASLRYPHLQALRVRRVDALSNVSAAHRAAAATEVLAYWPGGDRDTFLAQW